MSTTIFIPGKPAPQGSKRHVGKGILVESSKEVGPWRERIALAMYQARIDPIEGPVAVDISFVMPRPLSTPKRKTPPAIKKPDVDKLLRACLDAMSGICFRDDSQVVQLRGTKRLAAVGEAPGACITWKAAATEAGAE